MSEPPRPPKALALTLKVKPEQEHLLRRLGQALVLQWEELAPELQDALLDQAVMVDDREAATQSQIENFVRNVKSMAAAAPAKAGAADET